LTVYDSYFQKTFCMKFLSFCYNLVLKCKDLLITAVYTQIHHHKVKILVRKWRWCRFPDFFQICPDIPWYPRNDPERVFTGRAR
jgi:hypothetical protein